MADVSPTLMIRQCLKVSINQQCNESADSFQAVIQFADGACQNNGSIKTTEKYTLQNDYETCIRVGTDPICFSAVMSRNGVEVARTVSQELILLQCNTSSLSPNYNTGVQLTNSSGIHISPGVNVLHNTVLYLQCSSTCMLMGTNTTRCVNGTFEPLVNQSTYCNCPMDPPPLSKLLYRVSGRNTVILSTNCFIIGTAVIVVPVIIVVFIIFIIVVVVVIFVVVKCNLLPRSNYPVDGNGNAPPDNSII